jgi:flagella synthesis protein FlgN
MNDDTRRSVEELLDSEIEAAHALSATLAAERSALTGDSAEMVRQHAAEKVRVLETLERLETRRNQMFAAAGWGTAPEASRIADRWHALMELIANCRAANELNGYIIHVRQNQIRQLMDIVRGAAPAVYGPQGKTSAKALRPLAQA